jgi:hypothetical protein
MPDYGFGRCDGHQQIRRHSPARLPGLAGLFRGKSLIPAASSWQTLLAGCSIAVCGREILVMFER